MHHYHNSKSMPHMLVCFTTASSGSTYGIHLSIIGKWQAAPLQALGLQSVAHRVSCKCNYSGPWVSLVFNNIFMQGTHARDWPALCSYQYHSYMSSNFQGNTSRLFELRSGCNLWTDCCGGVLLAIGQGLHERAHGHGALVVTVG
jgi:hypothetical protein